MKQIATFASICLHVKAWPGSNLGRISLSTLPIYRGDPHQFINQHQRLLSEHITEKLHACNLGSSKKN